MTPSRRYVLVAAMGLSFLPFAGTARGGLKIDSPVSVASTADYAYGYGYAGTARNSPDSKQYLYCTTTGGYLLCGGGDASGNTAYCISTNPDLIRVGGTANGDSYIYFTASATGECEYVEIDQFSYTPPKGQ